MKKTIIFSAILAISGLLIALGPQYLFQGCAAGCCSAYPDCFWMTKFMLAMGLIIAALGIFCIIYVDPKIQMGMIIGIFLTGIITLLSVHVIIGGCDIPSMECNLVTIPVLTGLGILIIVISIVRFLSLRKS